MGATFKFSQQRLADTYASGSGLDAGLLYGPIRWLRLGLRVQNIVPVKLKYETATDQFPRTLTGGFALRGLRDKAALTFDGEKALDFPQRLRLRGGLALTLGALVNIRGGYDFHRQEFSMGLGYIWNRYGFDYASSAGSAGLSHRFGVTMSFGGYNVAIRARPETFSPVGINKSTTMGIEVYNRQRVHLWEVAIRNQNRDLVRSMRGSGQPPPKLVWDGADLNGNMVSAGNYSYTLTVIDMDGRKEITPAQYVKVSYGTPLDTLELYTR